MRWKSVSDDTNIVISNDIIILNTIHRIFREAAKNYAKIEYCDASRWNFSRTLSISSAPYFIEMAAWCSVLLMLLRVWFRWMLTICCWSIYFLAMLTVIVSAILCRRHAGRVRLTFKAYWRSAEMTTAVMILTGGEYRAIVASAICEIGIPYVEVKQTLHFLLRWSSDGRAHAGDQEWARALRHYRRHDIYFGEHETSRQCRYCVEVKWNTPMAAIIVFALSCEGRMRWITNLPQQCWCV